MLDEEIEEVAVASYIHPRVFDRRPQLKHDPRIRGGAIAIEVDARSSNKMLGPDGSPETRFRSIDESVGAAFEPGGLHGRAGSKQSTQFVKPAGVAE